MTVRRNTGDNNVQDLSQFSVSMHQKTSSQNNTSFASEAWAALKAVGAFIFAPIAFVAKLIKSCCSTDIKTSNVAQKKVFQPSTQPSTTSTVVPNSQPIEFAQPVAHIVVPTVAAPVKTDTVEQTVQKQEPLLALTYPGADWQEKEPKKPTFEQRKAEKLASVTELEKGKTAIIRGFKPTAEDMFGSEPVSGSLVVPKPTAEDMFGSVPVSGSLFVPKPTAEDMFGSEPVSGSLFVPKPTAEDMFGSEPVSGSLFIPKPTAEDMFGSEPVSGSLFVPKPTAEDMFGSEPVSGSLFVPKPTAEDMFGSDPVVGSLVDAQTIAKMVPPQPTMAEMLKASWSSAVSNLVGSVLSKPEVSKPDVDVKVPVVAPAPKQPAQKKQQVVSKPEVKVEEAPKPRYTKEELAARKAAKKVRIEQQKLDKIQAEAKAAKAAKKTEKKARVAALKEEKAAMKAEARKSALEHKHSVEGERAAKMKAEAKAQAEKVRAEANAKAFNKATKTWKTGDNTPASYTQLLSEARAMSSLEERDALIENILDDAKGGKLVVESKTKMSIEPKSDGLMAIERRELIHTIKEMDRAERIYNQAQRVVNEDPEVHQKFINKVLADKGLTATQKADLVKTLEAEFKAANTPEAKAARLKQELVEMWKSEGRDAVEGALYNEKKFAMFSYEQHDALISEIEQTVAKQ